ncbi:hypothetical protein CI109_107228 [Kwoniella shandongensis]|uniref:Glucosidase 2 subunit beta n=1 Tax=Kwoniella shandongensis TaxID=1734106 RepID=A0A5M6C7I9_9TREE|nr:uncharacterized protein CI109_002510 [Kwoniella shandongensis]KAA5529169.1 hypothetical protein CI109_002510 [Kwoniella shandongensis]
MPDKAMMLSTLLSGLLVLSPQLSFAEKKPVTPESIRGLSSALFDKYTPNSSGTFTCLDGSLTLPFSAINDDYCDCPDGSDEPGTSACPIGIFYCKNEGHIPGQVLSSRVNDGICDPECCDGSDEWATGACPDRCAEIGRNYREARDAEQKTRKTGGKIRNSYIKWATGEKKRLEEELEKKKSEVKAREAEVEKARVSLDKTEARSKQELDKKKQSPLYTSLLSHRLALTRLRSKTSRLQSELDTLHNILSELAKGYNPNYQDMAVKAAVVGYEELTGAAAPTEGEEPTAIEGEVKQEEEEKEEEISDNELDDLDRKDLEGLLLSDIGESLDDEDDDEDESSLLWKLDEYIPDSLYGSWESVRDIAIEWMIRFGLAGKNKSASKTSSADGPLVSAAREKHRNLANDLNKLNNDIRKTEDTLERMTLGYGPQMEWKKLDGTCIDKVSGDYTYELCFFGKATQKSNKDGSSNHMGTFSDWNTAEQEGSLAYYSQQLYGNGAKCWNGPLRSVKVDITCGTANALLSISEPEKCEYRFKVTSPAVCWPEQGEESVKVQAEQQEGQEAVKEEL